jgi:hypothetical protein
MTHQEIKELAGHRAVSPWVMKLVGDAVAKEREECWEIVSIALLGSDRELIKRVAAAIRARNNK